jgi:hypothetical protein
MLLRISWIIRKFSSIAACTGGGVGGVVAAVLDSAMSMRAGGEVDAAAVLSDSSIANCTGVDAASAGSSTTAAGDVSEVITAMNPELHNDRVFIFLNAGESSESSE